MDTQVIARFWGLTFKKRYQRTRGSIEAEQSALAVVKKRHRVHFWRSCFIFLKISVALQWTCALRLGGGDPRVTHSAATGERLIKRQLAAVEDKEREPGRGRVSPMFYPRCPFILVLGPPPPQQRQQRPPEPGGAHHAPLLTWPTYESRAPVDACSWPGHVISLLIASTRPS